MKTKTYLVENKDVGQRLDKWLTELVEISSRSYAQDLIVKNHVLVNDKVEKPSLSLKLNDSITVHFPEVQTTELIPYDYPLDIFYEDSDVIVINKPCGLVVHPAAGHQQDTLVNALIHYTKDLSMKNELRPGIVHRIDKETSGLLVIAKNDASHENLAEQFKNKTSHRVYFAVVDRDLKNRTGKIQSYIARHPVDRKRNASIRINNKIITTYSEKIIDGKWSITHYEKIDSVRVNKNNSFSYVRLQLETGRTHQIRVHLSELGHPLVGDLAYGYPKQTYLKLNLNRFFLHAAELGFTHPKTNETLLFKAPWPKNDILKMQEFGFANTLPGM
ncbi:MAG: RluA family pseudouridine synthase [Pseudobdellovibrio sp.]